MNKKSREEMNEREIKLQANLLQAIEDQKDEAEVIIFNLKHLVKKHEVDQQLGEDAIKALQAVIDVDALMVHHLKGLDKAFEESKILRKKARELQEEIVKQRGK